jgi:hypothetical protein
MFDHRIVSGRSKYIPNLDLKKPKIQCDQSNIIDVERGMWNVPKWVAIRSRLGSTPIVLSHVALLDSLEQPFAAV